MKYFLLTILLSLFLINYPENLKAEKTFYVDFEKKKFLKNSIGSLVKLKKIRKNCINDSLSFWGYSKCIDRHEKLSFLGNVYADKNLLNDLRRVLLINLRLNKLKIINDQNAFSNFDYFIFSENSQEIKENDVKKMQDFVDCNDNEMFSTFIMCFNNNFRSWQSYQKTDIRNKVILEEIVGYSLILLNKKRINTEVIFNTNKDINYVTHYKGKNYLINETLREESNQTFYLSKDSDGFVFLEKLIDYYTSDKYAQKINTELTISNAYQDYFIEKYENRKFWEKVEDFFENEDNQNTIKVAETALSIYFAYDAVKRLKTGNLTNVDDLIKNNKKNNVNTNNSNFSRGVIVSPNGKLLPGMFRFTPQGSVLRKKWTPIMIIKGGFF